ncbi:MAG TPA: glycosyl transferase [Xanthomonadales bacterium]|nr:glycosyl transferase [Xanthomonadales bacterium]
MMLEAVVTASEVVFLAYFLTLHGVYLLLNAASAINMLTSLRLYEDKALIQVKTHLDPPISLLVPAYNEEATIAASVRALLQIDYPDYEILVANDGSRDGTLDALIREFQLHPYPEAYRNRLTTQPVKAIYRSRRYRNLKVLDKANGGKADALNSLINIARYPLFACVDADSVLQRDSLSRIVLPFLTDPDTIAVGGTIRIANGCDIRHGFLVRTGLPSNPIAVVQIVEYLRAFLFGRLGWSQFNGVLIISGAFGLFHKETVIGVGGYRHDTLGEDMELVVRLHRVLSARGQRYRIVSVPDPVCWTEAPESLRVLYRQRTRWQRGLAESLWTNLGLLFARRSGAAGWLTFPFMLVFDLFGPILEVLGYVFVFGAYWTGFLNLQAMLLFLAVAIGFGVLVSIFSLLIEELSFRTYRSRSDLPILLLTAILENFGYRQLTSVWRFWATVKWLAGRKSSWGNMERKSNNQPTEPTGSGD